MLYRTLLAAILFLSACQTPAPQADVVIRGGNIWTQQEAQPTATALAIVDDRIVFTGDEKGVARWIGPETKVIQLKGEFVMPGFIEGHGHFSGLGRSLVNLNFLTSRSWDEILQMVGEAASKARPGEWIEGRGWHQEKWEVSPEPNILGYPFHQALSEVSPNNPVILFHASGHALLANEAAMKAAGISRETADPQGGAILRDAAGNAIGVFEERAMALVREAYNAYLDSMPAEARIERWKSWIAEAEKECLKKGVTSFQDAGSTAGDVTSLQEMQLFREMAEAGELDIRIWAMVRQSAEELREPLKQFPVIDAGNHFFTCRAIKSEVDGALGAFGAWLLRPYHDKPDFEGQNTTTLEEVEALAALAMERGMQFCVHAIGDRANREVLNIYEKLFAAHPDKKDLRWRVEHAQHLDTADIPRFARLGIVASMQGIHCTSDAPFVVSRLGEERSRLGAYPWRSLLDNGVKIANGTDAPVEDVDPLACFYASVTRKRADSGLEFFPEQRMTREEALYSYTLGNAYAAFEEKDKGSLEAGKLADLVVLSNDLRTCTDGEILQTRVLMTMVGGKVVFGNYK